MSRLALPCPACGGLVSVRYDDKAECASCHKLWKTAAAFYGAGYTEHEYQAACIIVAAEGRIIEAKEIADTLDHELTAQRYLRELARAI